MTFNNTAAYWMHATRMLVALIYLWGLSSLLLAQSRVADSSISQSNESDVRSRVRIQDICRLKGQEENTLQGLGIVVGLPGTGDDNSKPTQNGLAQMIKLFGGQIAVDRLGNLQNTELQGGKNVALVLVTATVPPAGAQQGDLIDIQVSALLSAKSLRGGNLVQTPLVGPRTDAPIVYALASGPIALEDVRIPTSGRVTNGCKMETSILNSFVKGDKFTLILDPDQSSFSTAHDIAAAINQDFNSESSNSSSARSSDRGEHANRAELLATAIDQVHIEVKIPSYYRGPRVVEFIADTIKLPIVNLKSKKRVVIKEREGLITIDGDVTIAPVVISHKNLSISTQGNGGRSGSFVGLNPSGRVSDLPKLKDLVDSLNTIGLPTEDIISIIKGIKKQGNLYAELIVE